MYVYICVYTHIHTYIYQLRMSVYVYTHIHTYIYADRIALKDKQRVESEEVCMSLCYSEEVCMSLYER